MVSTVGGGRWKSIRGKQSLLRADSRQGGTVPGSGKKKGNKKDHVEKKLPVSKEGLGRKRVTK